ncbi:MAG: hypothetical protein KC492_29965 [Myxococcales bacterium]|nr:hypothetical protein [Myxococcales bacterium]
MYSWRFLAVVAISCGCGVVACGSVSDASLNDSRAGSGGVGGTDADPAGGSGGIGGTSGVAGTAGTNQEPWEAFLDSVMDDYCSAMTPCCAAAGVATNPMCGTQRGAAKERFANLIARGSVQFDPSGTEACLAALQMSYTDCAPNTFSTIDERFCPEVFVPQVPVGAPCDDSFECQTLPGDDLAKCLGSQCFSGKASAALGDPCNYTCLPVAPGMTQCIGTIHRTGAGQCAYADGLACGVDGVCVGLLAEGERECGNFGCEENLQCVGGTCIPKLPTGSTCSFDRECIEGDWCSSGTCAERKQVGEACTDGTSMCYCSLGICREPEYALWGLLCN